MVVFKIQYYLLHTRTKIYILFLIIKGINSTIVGLITKSNPFETTSTRRCFTYRNHTCAGSSDTAPAACRNSCSWGPLAAAPHC